MTTHTSIDPTGENGDEAIRQIARRPTEAGAGSDLSDYNQNFWSRVDYVSPRPGATLETVCRELDSIFAATEAKSEAAIGKFEFAAYKVAKRQAITLSPTTFRTSAASPLSPTSTAVGR